MMMNAKPTIFMFSGQGSHYFQMGRELFEHNAAFRAQMLELDSVVARTLGESVLNVVYDSKRAKSDPWEDLRLTHPAIFMVQMAMVGALRAQGVVPDMVLGASLGTYVAATVAGCLEPEQALRAVILQAQMLEANARPGGMIGVLASPDLYHQQPELHGNSELAGVNFPSHFVVAAPHDRLDLVESCLRRHEVAHQRVSVRYAFHSRWIDDVELAFKAAWGGTTFARPKLPLLCCARAAAIGDLDIEHVWSIVRAPIRFQETIANLERNGSYRYVDVGPSGTLATYVKYNLSSGSASAALPILTPFGRDAVNLAKVA